MLINISTNIIHKYPETELKLIEANTFEQNK